MSRRLIASVALLVAVVAPAYAVQRGTVHFLVNPGAPRDEWQRRPLPGAFVVLTWTLTVPAPAHAVDKCLYSELARTDEKGDYAMEGPNPITGALAEPSYFVYAPGVEALAIRSPSLRDTAKDITMTFSSRTPENRLSQIDFFAEPGCFDRKLADPRALHVPLLRALLDEAQRLAPGAPRGRQSVEHIEAVLRRLTDPGEPRGLRVVPYQGPGRAFEAASPSPPAATKPSQ